MKVLVVVDMQNDFIDGALGTPEARAIVDGACKKIRGFDGKVMLTQDTHDAGYLDTQEGKLLPVEHCILNTDGWKLNQAVGEAVFTKSGGMFIKHTFGSVGLGQWLYQNAEQLAIDEVVLIGLCTDICVISNALLIKAFLPEVKVTVDAACCAGVTPESHANALAAMKMCQINIENWEEG